MIPVIDEQKWLAWCAEKQLPIKTAHFALDTCYYGLGFRSRPGTLLVTDAEILHYSYSTRDTLWAIGESAQSISIPLSHVREVQHLRLGLFLKLLLLMPESAFRVITDEGDRHDLVLQRGTDQFLQAIRSRGLSVLP